IDKVKQQLYYRYEDRDNDGIASMILRGFTGSCDPIILVISKPELSSNFLNSSSVLILPLCVSASISMSVNLPMNGSFPSGMIVSIINNFGLVFFRLAWFSLIINDDDVSFMACKQFFKIIAADWSSQFRITFFII